MPLGYLLLFSLTTSRSGFFLLDFCKLLLDFCKLLLTSELLFDFFQYDLVILINLMLQKIVLV